MSEKLYRQNETLQDHELLEILLFSSISRKNTNGTAHELLDHFGSLEGVFSAMPQALEKVSGIGKKSAELIRVVGLLIERIRGAEGQSPRLTNMAEVKAFAQNRFCGRNVEILEIYCLGVGGRLLCAKSYNCGNSERVAVESKTLNELFMTVQPLSVVVAHNHPSGRPEPSDGDDAAVREIYNICRINGIQFADSLIFAEGAEPYSYFLGKRFERLGVDRSASQPYIVLSNKKSKK